MYTVCKKHANLQNNINMIKLFYSKEVIKLKKRVRILIFTLLISMLGMINARAASLILHGDQNIAGGNTGSNDVIITTSSGEEIKSIEFSVMATDSSLVTLNITKNAAYPGSASISKTTLTAPEGSYFSNGSTIATLKITNNNIINTTTATTLKITNIVFMDKDGNPINGDDFSRSINLSPGTTSKPKSSNAKLTGLTISAGTITPTFNGSVTSYKVLNLKDTIKTVTISPKCDNCNYQIKCTLGCANYNNQIRPELIIGKNELTISTVSEDGNNNAEYNLIIYRGETTDNSAFLDKLEIENFKLADEFDKDKLDYILTVPNDTTFLNIIATPEDENAEVEIKGAEDLIVGENVITITITSSETSDKKIYNITVTRLDEDEVMTSTKPVVQPISKKSNDTLLIIIIIIVSILIIGVAGYLIFKKKKNKKNKPELITDEEEIKPDKNTTEIEVKENELIDGLNITEPKTKPTVEEALADLITTKEIILKEE